ncbi:hypothetical protein DV515_00015407 [Chloebia gouldiae]|uniref:Uncharacterized protein n=1 Tax=Chloebia gouldiae TaxID=44316 RepID=A0A3L8RVT8_CHLGU|nr:hypothetical protein DV515_00015407 [Chloebia gouldiae]
MIHIPIDRYNRSDVNLDRNVEYYPKVVASDTIQCLFLLRDLQYCPQCSPACKDGHRAVSLQQEKDGKFAPSSSLIAEILQTAGSLEIRSRPHSPGLY